MQHPLHLSLQASSLSEYNSPAAPQSSYEGMTTLDAIESDVNNIMTRNDALQEEPDRIYYNGYLSWFGACSLLWLAHWLTRSIVVDGPKSSSPDTSFSLNTLACATAVLILSLTIDQERASAIFYFLSKIPAWYMACLEKTPVVTKSLTTAVIQFIGDYFAQIFEAYRIRGVLGSRVQNYDLRRGLSLAADGMLLSGPLLHYAFDLMEKMLPTTEGQASQAALLHVLANDYLVDTIYLGISFFFVAIAEGHIKELVSIFQKDFFATVKASWCTSVVLIPVEFICFRYLSVSFRVLAMNFVDIIWGAIVSFVAHRSRRKVKATADE